jgi:hypothetical protein
MPPPCGVEFHGCRYKEAALRSLEDATPLRGGVFTFAPRVEGLCPAYLPNLLGFPKDRNSSLCSSERETPPHKGGGIFQTN